MHRPIIQLVELHIERCQDLRGLIHVPNEGKRSKAGHGIMVGLGLRKGASDLLLLRSLRGYNGLAMELKAPGKLGGATPEQKTFLRQQWGAGWLACVCDDPELGWALIAWYVGLPSRFNFDRIHPIAHIRWAPDV